MTTTKNAAAVSEPLGADELKLTDADIDRLESEAINLSGRVRREDWIGQAKALCLQKYGEPL